MILIVKHVRHIAALHQTHIINTTFLHKHDFLNITAGKHILLIFKKIGLSLVNFDANHAYFIIDTNIEKMRFHSLVLHHLNALIFVSMIKYA